MAHAKGEAAAAQRRLVLHESRVGKCQFVDQVGAAHIKFHPPRATEIEAIAERGVQHVIAVRARLVGRKFILPERAIIFEFARQGSSAVLVTRAQPSRRNARQILVFAR